MILVVENLMSSVESSDESLIVLVLCCDLAVRDYLDDADQNSHNDSVLYSSLF